MKHTNYLTIATVSLTISIVLLLYPGITFITGGYELASERFMIPLDSENAKQIGVIAGVFKGVTDLILIPILVFQFLKRRYSDLSFTCLIACLFIPILDLIVASSSAKSSESLLIHIPYIIFLSASSVFYFLYARQVGKNEMV